VIAIGFLAAGVTKLLRTRDQLRTSGMGWVDDFPARTIKLIRTAEVLGAIGLVLPAVVGVAEILVPIAATALAVLMLGAVVTHLRRHEIAAAVPSVVLLVLSVVVAALNQETLDGSVSGDA